MQAHPTRIRYGMTQFTFVFPPSLCRNVYSCKRRFGENLIVFWGGGGGGGRNDGELFIVQILPA